MLTDGQTDRPGEAEGAFLQLLVAKAPKKEQDSNNF
jgi:hypothetical protein